LMIATISTSGHQIHHRTIERPLFWIRLFEQSGFDYDFEMFDYFSPEWVRQCYGSFGIVMRRKAYE